MVTTLLWLYISRNFAKIVGLECPEPLANLYSRSYFRATWITTALDAGFWTAMKVRPNWLRNLASVVFTLYYLIAAEHADEKVRRVRATLTVEHLRVSWNKSTTPYISAINNLLRPRFTRYSPRAIRIPRPRGSAYREPVHAWLYFDGPLSALRDQAQLVLDIPGGGFVAMGPRATDDKLLAWAGKTGLPILSVDYKKAPEHPYPYALNECYDVYHTIVASRGRCVGFSGKDRPRIVITGESAGGNLAAGMTIMIVQSGSTETRKWHGETALPPPDGLILVYPSLDMNIGSWMTEEQMSLIQDKGTGTTNENVMRRKSEEYNRLTPKASHSQEGSSAVFDYFNHKEPPNAQNSPGASKLEATNLASQAAAAADNQPRQIKTRLAVSSMISYFGDRILTPEMMRAMIILYIGPHNRPDFKTDYLLSPVLAPEAVLAHFPKTHILTGERDPLVDDTVIFAGRIRQAKLHEFQERQDLGLEKSRLTFNEKDHVEVNLIPGISHGFMTFPGIFPDGWKQIHKCGRWTLELFEKARMEDLKESTSTLVESMGKNAGSGKYASNGDVLTESRRSSAAESSTDEDRPLEMNVGKLTPIQPPSTNGQGAAGAPGFDLSTEVATRAEKTKRKGNGSHNGSGAVTTKPRKTRPSLTDHNKPLTFPLTLPMLSTGMRSSNGHQGDHGPLNTTEAGKTVTRLPSEEDLIRRRMDGLAGGLMGIGEGARTP
jgi:acetyl esterase/lipase